MLRMLQSSSVIERKEEDMTYSSRGLSRCQMCGLGYDIGMYMPRILVQCGHTLCSNCIQDLVKEGKIVCPQCRKVLKKVQSIEKLPLNMDILYEVINNDKFLGKLDLNTLYPAEDEDNSTLDIKFKCLAHDDRVRHFYCAHHGVLCCRECIPLKHIQVQCFVVDLYEIHKMKQIHAHNMHNNQLLIYK